MSSELSIDSINKLCKGRKTEDLLAAEKDIQAEVEKGLLERKTAVINDNKVVFVDEEEGLFLGEGAERRPIPIFETDEITKIFQ